MRARAIRPHNGKVYDLGTDLGRARVVSEAIAKKARDEFRENLSADKIGRNAALGQADHPCAKFDGVSLENSADLSMADPNTHEGYNALPLGGVWAQAPYLHNGSVPTLFISLFRASARASS